MFVSCVDILLKRVLWKSPFFDKIWNAFRFSKKFEIQSIIEKGHLNFRRSGVAAFPMLELD